ncbi:hypothetical protein [uncultured Ruminococcus sp.]|uniref:hypothetical protein n=1 Tax=uncultured Ruminococcus sp. TaxID=165186 RepID=UPI002666CB88|nr:hypothetical protein [uncultured Ruminococcus sp.]
MTAKEIKDINREITRLKAKIARIAAEADNTSPKMSDLPSAGQTSDKIGNAVVQIFRGRYKTLKSAETQRSTASHVTILWRTVCLCTLACDTAGRR